MVEPALYVYGATRGDALPLEAPSLDGRHPVELVVDGNLTALVSEIDPTDLTRRVELAQEGDLSELAPWLFAHEHVLSLAQEAGPVAPFRFGVVADGRDGVHRLLEERRADLAAQLDRLGTAREWGVKGTIDGAALERFVIAHTPRLGDLAHEAEGSSGQAFFARKRVEREVETGVRDVTAEIAASVHERISSAALDAVANPPQGGMILNGAYLVEREDEPAFALTVTDVGCAFVEQGLTLELTGPWPAFNFVEALTPPDSP